MRNQSIQIPAAQTQKLPADDIELAGSFVISVADLRECFVIQNKAADRRGTSTALTVEPENPTKGFPNLTVRFARLTVIARECFLKNDL